MPRPAHGAHGAHGDRALLVKSLTRAEARTLRRILPSYADHTLLNAGHTLLPRFLAVFQVASVQGRDAKGPPQTFVVMPNLLYAAAEGSVALKEVFDLKGSSHNRWVDVIPRAEVPGAGHGPAPGSAAATRW